MENRYRSAEEFIDPFYIIVHASSSFPRALNPTLVQKVLEEIKEIKNSYDYVEMNEWPPQTILPETPSNRPLLVCGFFDYVCVEEQRNALRKAGCEAYISKKGTF